VDPAKVTLAGGVSAAGSVAGSVVIAPNTSSSVVQFTPGSAGSQTDIQVTQPTGWQTPNKFTKVTMSVQ
jgi:hypothetical protein